MFVPKFTITNRILKNIGSIEASKEVIDKAPLLPYYEKQFQNDAIVRAVHHGTHIEGNELNFSQAQRVLSGEEVTARERDVQEVINYRKVMELISSLQTRLPDGQIANKQSLRSDELKQSLRSDELGKWKIDEELIKKIHEITIHKILHVDQQGAYRKTQVVVKNSKTGQVSFRPPMAVAVPFQIKDLLTFLNQENDLHPVLKSGIVHYELVRIHPFLDGNGRVARAISTLILFQEGYDIRKFFSLEEYFDSNASDYYKALQSVEKNGRDLTDWLTYFSEGMAIELSKIKAKVERISIDANLRKKLGGKPVLLSDRQLKIIEYIQKVGYLQNRAFDQLFPMVSEDTILNELKALYKLGLVKKQGITKAAKYIMT